jgi:hypothetical protein
MLLNRKYGTYRKLQVALEMFRRRGHCKEAKRSGSRKDY